MITDQSWDEVPAAVSSQFSEEAVTLLSDLRRDLHRHPELAWQEIRTSTKLLESLVELGLEDVRRVAETAVVGIVPGQDRSAPRVALRGDIDALPIPEDTGLEFSSQNEGVMHACGHDVHASWAVGAAMLLSRRPAAGDVLILLQPAEEVGQGASRVLETGVLDNVSSIFGAHVDRRFPIGQVVAQSGAVGAAADTFEIVLQGRGGHGARPQLSHDPIVAAAALVQSLQTIVSRTVEPGRPAVVTVGTLQAGTADNVIPETARLTGTLRSLDLETREILLEQVRHHAGAVASSHKMTADVRLIRGTPPVLNTPEEAELARKAVGSLLGDQALVPLPGYNMGGEDFAFYLEKIPGCFLRIGAREAAGSVVGAHTPQFYAAEGSLFVGAAVLAETARLASLASCQL